ncbi:hypothetical protein Pst134EB_023916 [Puccinia striiformis f. sp. tritici]|nr:hypothetical protein Pst134EB_023916 [Puccinia striiformis f. sp. tritici]
MSQPPLSPERQERLEEIKHLIARERLLIQESALLAYNGNPLVNDQLNILLDDNSINPLALYRLIRLINRKIVVEQGSNARKWPLPGSHMTPSMVAFFVDQPGSSSHLSVTTPSHQCNSIVPFAILTLEEFDQERDIRLSLFNDCPNLS